MPNSPRVPRAMLLTCGLVLSWLAIGTTSAQASILFWTEYGSIYRSALDGSGKQQIFTASEGGGNACSLAIDYTTEQLYWWGRPNISDLGGNGIVARMNLDGSRLTQVITQSQGLGTITYGFDVDSTNRTMYLMDGFQMKRANLDGTGITNLPNAPWYTSEIQVDSVGGRVYYNGAQNNHDGIRSTDLDGNDLQYTFTGAANAFSIDFMNNQIYLGSGYHPYVGNMEIDRVNLDGSGMQSLVSGLTLVHAVETDIEGGKVYWMTPTVIQRANLDGSGVETIVNLSGSGPLGKEDMIVFTRASVVPAPASLAVWSVLGIIGMTMIGWRNRKN